MLKLVFRTYTFFSSIESNMHWHMCESPGCSRLEGATRRDCYRYSPLVMLQAHGTTTAVLTGLHIGTMESTLQNPDWPTPTEILVSGWRLHYKNITRSRCRTPWQLPHGHKFQAQPCRRNLENQNRGPETSAETSWHRCMDLSRSMGLFLGCIRPYLWLTDFKIPPGSPWVRYF